MTPPPPDLPRPRLSGEPGDRGGPDGPAPRQKLPPTRRAAGATPARGAHPGAQGHGAEDLGARRGDVGLPALTLLVAEDLGLDAHLLPGDVLELRGPVPARLGLGSLRASCAQEPRVRWPELIAQHLHHALRLLHAAPDHGDWAAVRTLVRSRPFASDWLPGSARAVTRELAPGLVEALVLALPGSVSVVPRRALRTWPLSPSAALAAGRAATHADEPVRTTRVDLPGDVHAVEGGSLTLGHLPCLDAHVPPAEHGALVALPRRDALLAAPLGEDVERSVAALLALAARLHADGPGATSRELYWRLPSGDLVHLPHAAGPSGPVLHPPPSFLRVLDGLHGR